MYVRKVNVSNVRGFHGVDLDFTRPDGSLAGWTVLAGRNGSGKSTLLRAIALTTVGPLSARTLQESFAGWIRIHDDHALVELLLQVSAVDRFSIEWPEQFGAKRFYPSPRARLYWGVDPLGRSEPVLAGHDQSHKETRSEAYLPPVDVVEKTLAETWREVLGLPNVGAHDNFFDLGGHSLNLARLASLLRMRTGIEVSLVQLFQHPTLAGMAAAVHEVLLNNGPWSNSPDGWFIAGYGPYRRLAGQGDAARRLMAGTDAVARLVSLFREDASLIESVDWLREIYLRRLEDKPGAAKLEQAILALLNDGLLPAGLRVEAIDSEALWVSQRGVRLPLNELSDGYRTVAALVMDIVRHLYRCFGELQIESVADSEGTLQRVLHPGVILIDEVELHLHVSWQKGIGFWLKRHFPNIQFIVTTHSPFVCQAADPRGLIRLPAPGEERQVEHVSDDLYNTVVNGSADDAVLTELFGLDTPYSSESEKLREEVARIEAGLQTGDATTQDEQRLEELRSRLPQTPGANIEQLLRKLTADA